MTFDARIMSFIVYLLVVEGDLKPHYVFIETETGEHLVWRIRHERDHLIIEKSTTNLLELEKQLETFIPPT